MSLKHLYKFFTGKIKAKNKAKISFKTIFAVIQSYIRSIFPTPKYIKEQIEYRRNQVQKVSPECLKSGSCVYCGCDMNYKLKADIGCENNPSCYPEMMSKKEWKVFKSKL